MRYEKEAALNLWGFHNPFWFLIRYRIQLIAQTSLKEAAKDQMNGHFGQIGSENVSRIPDKRLVNLSAALPRDDGDVVGGRRRGGRGRRRG